jgi:hypothetical protein
MGCPQVVVWFASNVGVAAYNLQHFGGSRILQVRL